MLSRLPVPEKCMSCLSLKAELDQFEVDAQAFGMEETHGLPQEDWEALLTRGANMLIRQVEAGCPGNQKPSVCIIENIVKSGNN